MDQTALDWTALAQLPMTVLFGLAALALLFALIQAIRLGHRRRERRAWAASWHALLLLIGLALGLLLFAIGWTLRGYRLLGEETPVVAIDARILSPQRWALTLTRPDGQTRQLGLAGDAWSIEAVVLKWKLPALLAGVPPLYRLDRLSGRYDDLAQETSALRTVIDFNPGPFDLLQLRKEYPQWLPMVDTVYGSGVYLPLVDQGHYQVSLLRTGALIARPDEATAQRIGQPLGE